MKKKENKSPKNWWFCENEYCRHPLGKIVKGDFMNVEIIEIEGKNGEKFEVNPKFIDVFCKKCGEKNKILGGKLLSEDWNNNLKKNIEWEEELNNNELPTTSEEFFINPYKRNLLLRKLTEKQKKIFNFLMQHKDYKELEFEKIAKELNISKDILLQDMRKIDLIAINIDHEIGMKNDDLLIKDVKATVKKFKSMQ